ncbi:MAG: hypothetical protein P4L20_13015 [Acidimicrobiales bacterium]|nr:hypothetical protein [Acidimicrobiales bacterium]
MDAPRTARAMWKLFEPLHALTYFAPECIEEFGTAGLKGFWMGYFAGRAAPMGEVGPAVVDATFFSFNPDRVRRALPDAWSFAPPDRVLDARLAGVARALERILGAGSGADGDVAGIGARGIGAPEIARAAALARSAVEGLTIDGRPLAAANVALAWPEEPRLALWHAATVLREHRGDGHVAALVAAGLDGRQALVTMTATGAVPKEMLQAARGWDDDAWEASAGTLVERGWINEDGTQTASGAKAREDIEDLTDLLAAEPWERLGEDGTDALRAVLAPIASAIGASGSVPVPNPIGLPLPR